MTRKHTAVKQPEFRGMPPKTKSVLRAEEYCSALDDVAAKKENANHRMLALVGQLKADNAVRVTCLDAIGSKRSFVLETLEKLKAKKGSA